MTCDDVFGLVGKTPCVRVRTPDDRARIFMKLEGANPSGSVKDRACASMLRAALADGALQPGRTLLDASSGNFACALVLFGKALGYATTVAVSSKLTAAKRDFLTYLGATIHQIGDFTIQGNEFCRQLAARDRGAYCFLDQLHNWSNPRAHYDSTGPEIIAAVPDVHVIVGTLGSGGTMLGTAEYFAQHAPHVRIVVVESASGSRIPGTGTFLDGDYVTPFIAKGFAEGYFDQRVYVTEADAARVNAQLVAQGIFGGLQTGAVMQAALTIAAEAPAGQAVVALSGDTGWKNLDKLVPRPAETYAGATPW